MFRVRPSVVTQSNITMGSKFRFFLVTILVVSASQPCFRASLKPSGFGFSCHLDLLLWCYWNYRQRVKNQLLNSPTLLITYQYVINTLMVNCRNLQMWLVYFVHILHMRNASTIRPTDSCFSTCQKHQNNVFDNDSLRSRNISPWM